MIRLAVPAVLSGCIAASTSATMSAPLDGAPSRGFGGDVMYAPLVRVHPITVEPMVGAVLAPLEKSNALGQFGARVSTLSQRRTPGYFVALLGGTRDTDDHEASLVRASAGVAWTHVSPGDDWFPGEWARASVGLVYQRAYQDDIDTGQFLGVEISLAVGVNAARSFMNAYKRDAL